MNNLKAERTLTAEDRVSDERLSGLAQACHIRQINMTADTVVISMTDHLDIVAALTELQSLRSQALSTQQPMVEVKMLEWESYDGRSTEYAESIVGTYSVWDGHFRRPNDYGGTAASDPKSAAQEDYRKRILSALHPNQESGE